MILDTIVDFFNSEYVNFITGFTAVVAFGISLYNFIVPIVKSRLNFEVTIKRYSAAKSGYQYVQLDIINKSHARIVITDIAISSGDSTLQLEKIKSFTNKDGIEFAAEVPLSIAGEDCSTGVFVFQCNGQTIHSGKAKVTFTTNKGKTSAYTFLLDPSDASRLTNRAK